MKFILKNKLFIHYLTIAIVIAGTYVLLNMQREARPNVNFNRVVVSVAYPGASPSDIEDLIVEPLEDKIAEVDGVKEYRSVSVFGSGSISIQLDEEYPNIKEIVDSIRQKVAEVRGLPEAATDPVVVEAKATNIPVLRLALFGDTEAFNLKLETEKLKDFLKLQKDVQSVSSTGANDLQLKVLANPDKLLKYDITLEEILLPLSSWSNQSPGGLYENSSSVASLTIGKNLNELQDLNSFIIRSNDAGKVVRLSDVADIKFDLESSQRANLFEGKEAILLTVIKKPFADSINVVDSLNRAIKKYQEGLPKDLSIKVYNDQSIRIRDKLKIVIFNALSGLFLVLVILLCFLDKRSAFVASIGIPIAVLGGFCVLYALGYTLNSLVVVGIIIVLGMLVDDAIVVCENIYSNIEKNMTPHQAVLKGVSEISLPVIASVLTTVFAFLPIVFMEGIIGQFLSVIPVTVIALLSISLIEALLILPVHAEDIMKKKTDDKVSFFKFFEDKYKRYIYWSINKRFFIIFVLSLFMAVSAFQGKKIFERFSLFPADGLDGFSVRVQLERGTPMYKTRDSVKKLSAMLIEASQDSFENIYTNIGQVRTGGGSGSQQTGSHYAQVNVSFKTDSSIASKEKQIIKGIREAISEYSEAEKVKASLTIDRPGPPIGKPIQFQIASRDFSLGEKIARDIKLELEKINGVHSIETDLDGDNESYRFLINNELAIAEGVSPERLSRTIFSSSTGLVASEILKNNEKIEILVSVGGNTKSPVESILDLRIRNGQGYAVPLGSYVKIVKENGLSAVQRLNGLRTITLFGEVDDKVISSKEASAKIRPFIKKLSQKNQSVGISSGGRSKDRLSAVKDTGKLYIFAMLLIFMVISLAFQSTIYPFLVFTAIPMGIGGVVWSLVIHGKSLSIMGIIGIIGLSGVVVNISILFLKFVQDRLAEGVEFKEAIVSAGVARLRPIVMTTLSTLIGLLPTIYGIGGIDYFVQPIALVLGWGLFVSAILTLLCLPAIISFCPFLKKK